MLSLTRLPGEKIFIGKDIMIVVASVEPGRVRLAISAPKDTVILRGELAGAKAQGAASR